MKLLQKLLIPLILFFVAFLSIADFALRPGHPITFDGHIHMTTMNQFAQALTDGEFPVRWSNNFANFGHPLPLIAHQVPAYLGGILIFLGLHTDLAFLTVLFAAIVITTFAYFFYFKRITSLELALTATILATFIPYRALNIYTRGALPELLAMIWLPVLFLAVEYIFDKKYQVKGLVLLFFATLLTVLTHPMMLLIFAFPTGAYFLYQLFTKTKPKQRKKIIALSIITGGLAVLTSAYYLFPLLIELRYFHQVKLEPNFTTEMFLTVKQLFDPTWYYTFTHPGPRGNYIKLGSIEFGILISAIVTTFYSLRKKKIQKKDFPLIFWSIVAATCTLLLLPISEPIYHLPIIQMIQYPWRMLSVLQFMIPLLLILLLEKYPQFKAHRYLLVIVCLVLLLRVPQFYGKNYVFQPEFDFQFTKANLHSTNLNTVWSSDTDDYPTKTQQAEIIEGEGKLLSLEEKNASRLYEVETTTELRILENTFYFPGWIVEIDEKPVEIQYQDPNYRGLITFQVPEGSKNIEVRYTQTFTRQIADILSIIGIILAGLFFYILKQKPSILKVLE